MSDLTTPQAKQLTCLDSWVEHIKTDQQPLTSIYIRGNENFLFNTNLQNKGLISADRGTKATLMRTIPRSLFKSYTKDLSLPIFELVIQHRLTQHFTADAVPSQCYDLGHARKHAYTYS